VDTATQSTGQALGVTENIRPIAHFPSVVTLKSVTPEEFIFYLKTLMATKSYGAETRIKGDVVNTIVGVAGGFEEIITSLEYSLELASRDWSSDPVAATEQILKKYSGFASMPDQVKVLSKKELEELVKSVRKFKIDREFIEKLKKQALDFAKQVGEAVSAGKKKGR